MAVVEVMKRHAQVCQDAVDAVFAVEAKEVFDKAEIAVHEREARVVDAVGISVEVLVEAVEPSVCA